MLGKSCFESSKLVEESSAKYDVQKQEPLENESGREGRGLEGWKSWLRRPLFSILCEWLF